MRVLSGCFGLSVLPLLYGTLFKDATKHGRIRASLASVPHPHSGGPGELPSDPQGEGPSAAVARGGRALQGFNLASAGFVGLPGGPVGRTLCLPATGLLKSARG